jgi:hypothetical protein
MAIGIEAARKRLHTKLSRKFGNKREYPWYQDCEVRGDRIEVLVKDVEAAKAALQQRYYGFALVLRNPGDPNATAEPAYAAPAPTQQEPSEQGPQAPPPEGPQAPPPAPEPAPAPPPEAPPPETPAGEPTTEER